MTTLRNYSAICLALFALSLTSCVTQKKAEEIVYLANADMVASVESALQPSSRSAVGGKNAELQLRNMLTAQASNPNIAVPLQFRLAMLYTVKGDQISARSAWNEVNKNPDLVFNLTLILTEMIIESYESLAHSEDTAYWKAYLSYADQIARANFPPGDLGQPVGQSNVTPAAELRRVEISRLGRSLKDARSEVGVSTLGW